jgi:hypothetical protein
MKRFLTLALLILASWLSPASATTIRFMPFDEEFLSADMIAVVECETAGVICCRVKVLDSIKGPPVRASLVIRSQPDYWGPAFPAIGCGRKYLLAVGTSAKKSNPATKIGRWTRTSAPSEARVALAKAYGLPFRFRSLHEGSTRDALPEMERFGAQLLSYQ